jgi:hypothetical protein
MDTEDLAPRSQGPATRSYPEQSTNSCTISLKYILLLLSYMCLGFPSDFVVWIFQPKFFYVFVFCPLPAVMEEIRCRFEQEVMCCIYGLKILAPTFCLVIFHRCTFLFHCFAHLIALWKIYSNQNIYKNL